MAIMWTNPALRFLRNEEIVEWDIKAANVSLMQMYSLASEDTISAIRNMDGHDRKVAVGKLYLKDKTFGPRLEQAFTDIIERFERENNLDRDRDVISIKRDALFVRNRTIRNYQFDDCVLFRPKGRYTGYMHIKNPKAQLEFYRGKDTLDVKGIDSINLALHENGMLEFIRNVFDTANSRRELILYMKEYASAYKQRLLQFDSYREFNMGSHFKVRLAGYDVNMDAIDDIMLEKTDISFNYINIVLEVLKLIVG